MHRITSQKNLRVKQAAKLRQRRQREKQQRFIIDGRREISRAMDAGVEFVEAYVCESTDDVEKVAEAARSIVEALERQGVAISIVSGDVFEKVCFGDRDEGIVAVGKTPVRTLDRLQLPENPLVAVIETLEKPGNVGAILRSADGAGIDAVIVADPRTDLFNPGTIRASLGTVFASSICTASSAETIQWLRQRKIPLYAARPDGSEDYASAVFAQGAAIILGSEADGLTEAWRQDDVLGVRLPMAGIADSLNVSATAAVLFYEARRQRNLGQE